MVAAALIGSLLWVPAQAAPLTPLRGPLQVVACHVEHTQLATQGRRAYDTAVFTVHNRSRYRIHAYSVAAELKDGEIRGWNNGGIGPGQTVRSSAENGIRFRELKPLTCHVELLWSLTGGIVENDQCIYDGDPNDRASYKKPASFIPGLSVVLEVSVGDTGTPRSVRVTQSSGSKQIDRDIVAAVRRGHFPHVYMHCVETNPYEMQLTGSSKFGDWHRPR